MFSKKATKVEEIFTVDLTKCSKCQINGEDFVNFCGLPRKHSLYKSEFGRNHKLNWIVLFDRIDNDGRLV